MKINFLPFRTFRVDIHTMYALLALVLFIVFNVVPVAAQLTEGFETGLPTTAATTATNYTLSSGEWTLYRCDRSTTKHSGQYAVRLASGTSAPSYIITPALNTVGSITLWTRGAGAGSLTISKSVNGGAYSTIVVQKITSAYASYTIPVNEAGSNVRIKFQNGTVTSEYIDDLVITTSSVVPGLSVNPMSLAYGNVVTNTTSQRTYTLSGTNLNPATGSISITAPSGYLVSTVSGSGFASSVSVPYSGGSLASTTVYVNFTPTSVQAYNGNIVNAGGGATTQNVAVSGNGVSTPTPSLSVSPSSLAFGSILVNTTSQKSYTLSGSALAPASGIISVTAPGGYLISTASGSGFASSISVPYSGGSLASTTIYVNFKPAAIQSYSGNITNAGGGATSMNVVVSGAGVNEPSPSNMIGFATLNGGTTGGAAGPTVTVSNASDFETYVGSHDPYVIQVSGTIDLGGSQANVRENKTIIGLGADAGIIGGLKISHYNNLIVRNLTIQGSNGDGLTIQDCRNVWIDHCTIIDASDGSLDIVHASDWVTVSWCKFYYTINSGHNYVNLIGHSDSNSSEDMGTLHVTFHNNWWSTLSVERMPSVRFGRVHLFNNYFNAPGNNYCIRTRLYAEVLAENNYFENVKNPWEQYVTDAGGTPGKLRASGNVEVNCTRYVNPVPDGDGNQSFLIPGNDVVFTPPYPYTLEPASSVKDAVMAGSGAGSAGFTKSTTENNVALLNTELKLNSSDPVDLYPNPAREALFIRLNKESSEGALVQLFDNTGKLILTKRYKGLVNSLETRNLPSGFYLVKIATTEKTLVKRIVKQ
jgi:pectate lyase